MVHITLGVGIVVIRFKECHKEAYYDQSWISNHACGSKCPMRSIGQQFTICSRELLVLNYVICPRLFLLCSNCLIRQ